MSASVTHAENYSFVTKFDVDGFENDVAVDSSGNVYVPVEWCNIYKFDSNGKFLTRWSTSGCASDDLPIFNGPTSVAVDSSGNVYAPVSENLSKDVNGGNDYTSENFHIQKFDSNGSLLTQWGSKGSGNGQFKHPCDIAVDSSGNVYVADSGNNRTEKFDKNGKFITKWGSSGSGDGQFNHPNGVAVDFLGNVYVADNNNHRIQKFDSNGKFITKWGSWGSGDGQFNYNIGVAVDSSGNVYVADTYNHRIQKFDKNGKFITKWGSSGSGDGQFNTPTDIAVDSLGYVYVADTGNCIQKFAPVSFNVTPSKIRITDNVQFNASKSVTGTQSGIIWEFGDGLTDESGQSVVNHNYSKPGSYVVNLTIIDSTGAPKTTYKIVNVTIPVVLVHGWRSSSDMWQGMSAALQKEGFVVWNFDYNSSNTADPRTISPKLAANITERRSDLSYNGQKYTGKIDIVCHSMGAIVSRLYMEKDDGGIHGKDVRQWIGIAPAHGGAASADNVAKYASPVLYLLRWDRGALSELKTTSSTVNSLGPLSPTTKYWVIAGWNPTLSPKFGSGVSATLAKNETGSYYWTYSGDMIVATQQSYNENMEFEAFPPVSGDLGGSPAYEFDHTHICNSPKVIAYVIDCLKNINKHSSKQKPPEEKAVLDFTFLKKSVEGALGTMKKLITLPLSVPVFGSSNGGSNQMMAMSDTGATVQATEDNVLYVLLDWDQGDIDMSLISPSGVEYTEDSHPDNVWFLEEENSITAIVVNPESGDWKSNLDPVSYPGQDIVYTLTSILRTSSESEIMPFANFTANVTEGYAPLSVQFVDHSENATGWSWDFGDGVTSNVSNPVHTYSAPGYYTITLTVTNTAGTDTVEGSDYITVKPGQDPKIPFANFSASPVSGDKPLKVKFTDTSTGNINKWYWDFGDSVHSYSKNPSHKYTDYGSFKVRLTVSNTTTGANSEQYNYINITAPPEVLNANFTSNVTSGYAPLNVSFTNTSTGNPTAWKWKFGDGATSTEKNPTHVYSNAGKYTVVLTASNAAGTDTVEETDYINVSSPNASDFSASQTSGNAPLKVTFTDKSAGTPTRWKWNFGDGIRSTSQNAVHTYTEPGIYNASLSVYVSNVWLPQKVVPITVTELPVAPVVDFSMSPSSGYAPLLVKFTDKSTGSPTSWNWNFGDGATSTAQNPTHTYSKVGNYAVTLNANYPSGVISKTAEVNVLPTTLPVADFESNVKSGVSPLSVQFKDKSSGEPISWLWDFGDGATSTDKNPVHIYSAAGTYAVSLTVTNAFGTDTVEEADYINVTSSPQLVADFSASPTSGYVPLKVAFADKSTGSPTSWNWNFGDNTRSTSKNIAHTYKKVGIYTATLKVTDANGATASKSTEITVSNVVKPVAAFYGKPVSGKAPLTVRFYDRSTNIPTKWQWSFGDSSTSKIKSPSHTYSKAGKYTVKLTATNAAGSSKVTKYSYIVVK